MKLVLANNQTDRFMNFHTEIQGSEKFYDYSSYSDLLFFFEKNSSNFWNVATERSSDDYNGVYLNGYMYTPELAIAAATVLAHNKIPFVNDELANPLSLSKISAYAKLSAGGVSIPSTYGGTPNALIKGLSQGKLEMDLPVILKRADADRGIDNVILHSYDEVIQMLEESEATSLWVCQKFVPNSGFYVVSVSHYEARFGIYRTLEKRPDGDKRKAHMYKPKGGANASLIEASSLPPSVADTAEKASRTLKRNIGSVDIVCDNETQEAYVLEVNYNPQLVTVSIFNEERNNAFIDAIRGIE